MADDNSIVFAARTPKSINFKNATDKAKVRNEWLQQYQWYVAAIVQRKTSCHSNDLFGSGFNKHLHEFYPERKQRSGNNHQKVRRFVQSDGESNL